MDIKTIYKDLKYAAEKLAPLHKHIKSDFNFEQGKQWEDSDVLTLRNVGVKALTINKIKPIIKLITGLERQSRSDFIAFPEGEEDTISAEIATKLVKNVSKNSYVQIKTSEAFKHGCIGGLSFIEPYIDYSYDLLNGEMMFKKISGVDVYFDPDFQEYDMSDCKYIAKVTRDLAMEDLEMLFPGNKKLKKITDGKINWDSIGEFTAHIQGVDYPKESNTTGPDFERPRYDLIDYYYKEMRNRFYVVSADRGIIEDQPDEETAMNVAAQLQGQVVAKKVPFIMHAQCVGDVLLSDDICWSYPLWRSYPLFPFFAELITEELDDYSLRIQGVVRAIKDLQEEYNKRRTQELRHLNASANSGFDIEEGQLDDENMARLKAAGSSPGVVVVRRKNTPPLTRITPMPLSQGHAQLAEENSQDLKEASGVNPDLLANDSQSQSGRAILFKQRQGLVMVQEMLDNYAMTKKLIGKFIISQLKELFTVETAMRVLGNNFIADNFTTPINIILERGLAKVQNQEQPTELEQAVMLQYPTQQAEQPIMDERGQLVTTVDFDTAKEVIGSVLNEAQLSKYDISVGEGPFQDTIRLANFMDLKDLASQGVLIPPNVLIEQSMIPQGEKTKILKQMEAQAMSAQAAMAQGGGKPQNKPTEGENG